MAWEARLGVLAEGCCTGVRSPAAWQEMFVGVHKLQPRITAATCRCQ